MIIENKKYKNDENESPNDDSIEETDQIKRSKRRIRKFLE